ncbi:MAG TPA: phosphate ABC transporter substrate-binding protein PstS [Pyrinomonadaceae bacterium]|jgi:phosphate transport system substrate-binding protein|nr:phosphate ABC transporter substrate-binding protein PstS [Pyrinomonadaceae bacterium]
MPSANKITSHVITLLLAFILSLAAGCSGEHGGTTGAGRQVRLQGAGATFPNPLYQKWLSEYGKLNPNIRIDYQSIGSGGGIKQIKEQTVDFGASDSPMKDEDLRSAPGEIIHIPTVLGAVVITYNLQGIQQPLRFSPEVIADIFLGKIKRWDDARIKADNAGGVAALPATDITVVHRSDGSGTSAVFTDYLSKVSPEWKEKVGSGTSPNWPVGLGGKGNEGVTGQVKQTPNTIGYVELAYAVQNKLPVALIKNSSGNFVEPGLDSVTAAAAESVATTPEDLRVSITNAAGATAYPISSYTYVLAYKEQRDAARGKALVDFLWWGIHDGEKYARDLQYAPLPQEIVRRAEDRINAITQGGKPLRAAQ